MSSHRRLRRAESTSAPSSPPRTGRPRVGSDPDRTVGAVGPHHLADLDVVGLEQALATFSLRLQVLGVVAPGRQGLLILEPRDRDLVAVIRAVALDRDEAGDG